MINECGTKDLILLINHYAVLFLGMAGRIGFSKRFCKDILNRYYPFGHSGYFQQEGFMREKWLPLITSDEDPEPGEPHRFNWLNLMIAKGWEPFKVAFYLFLAAGLLSLLLILPARSRYNENHSLLMESYGGIMAEMAQFYDERTSIMEVPDGYSAHVNWIMDRDRRGPLPPAPLWPSTADLLRLEQDAEDGEDLRNRLREIEPEHMPLPEVSRKLTEVAEKLDDLERQDAEAKRSAPRDAMIPHLRAVTLMILNEELPDQEVDGVARMADLAAKSKRNVEIEQAFNRAFDQYKREPFSLFGWTFGEAPRMPKGFYALCLADHGRFLLEKEAPPKDRILGEFQKARDEIKKLTPNARLFLVDLRTFEAAALRGAGEGIKALEHLEEARRESSGPAQTGKVEEKRVDDFQAANNEPRLRQLIATLHAYRHERSAWICMDRGDLDGADKFFARARELRYPYSSLVVVPKPGVPLVHALRQWISSSTSCTARRC